MESKDAVVEASICIMRMFLAVEDAAAQPAAPVDRSVEEYHRELVVGDGRVEHLRGGRLEAAGLQQPQPVLPRLARTRLLQIRGEVVLGELYLDPAAHHELGLRGAAEEERLVDEERPDFH